MTKNLVICCDGTNNEITGSPTNVLRLFRMLEVDAQQIGFYDAGVGTKADPTAFWPWRRFLHKKLDSAVGMSIRPNVLDAYRFLLRSYEPGDRIFLFGFSRGAYAVRALAGMIKRCGLLRSEHEHLSEYAWSLYSDEDRSGRAKDQFGGTARLKKTFARAVNSHAVESSDRDVTVYFVGLWDTVSAFGWLWDPLTLPDTRRNSYVTYVRHALSIDETRSHFRPNHVEPVAGQDCKAVWFAGVHADVGGGYAEDESGLARISLCWMLAEAKRAGLRTIDSEERRLLARMGGEERSDAAAKMHDEAGKRQWKLLSLLPRVVQTVRRDRKGTHLTRSLRFLNLASRRHIPAGAFVHESVRDRMTNAQLNYRPDLPCDVTFVATI